MSEEKYDICVIGAGPAGMAAALEAAKENPENSIALIEREAETGGILKQCIHDGFGLIKFKARLTGPEYAFRYKKMLEEHKNIKIFCFTFLTKLEKIKDENGEELFQMEFTNPERGVFTLTSKALIAAMGCRERTDRQVSIQGNRPAGIFTAGQAQAFINLFGYLPGKRCVILGSGDIGLIMARRLTLEGAKVEGVYEIKPTPSGLTRNIVQCLEDYGIPLHLATTVTSVKGKTRVEAVEVMKVDENMRPIPGTEEIIPCDTLILSVGLIPENDILMSLNPEMDRRTKGAVVDQFMHTRVKGLFSCGNALHVNDLADYVSESGEIAGKAASEFVRISSQKECSENTADNDNRARIKIEGKILYLVPQEINTADEEKITFYFRASEELQNAKLVLKIADEVILEKKYRELKPPEMERFIVSGAKFKSLSKNSSKDSNEDSKTISVSVYGGEDYGK